MDARSTEIARNVEMINDRIRRACGRVGRAWEGVTLVAVSKRFSISDIRHAYQAGVRHFGENRVQELVEKTDKWRSSYPSDEIYWHMVGHLQRNKSKDVIGRCSLFHALDSFRLAEALNQRAQEREGHIDCLVQVNVSREASKFGYEPEETEAAIDALRRFQNLRLKGLMTLAHPVDDPEEVRPEFGKLRTMYERIQAGDGQFNTLSMGMSGDFEVAIEEGATHIRLGTAIFGDRP